MHVAAADGSNMLPQLTGYTSTYDTSIYTLVYSDMYNHMCVCMQMKVMGK